MENGFETKPTGGSTSAHLQPTAEATPAVWLCSKHIHCHLSDSPSVLDDFEGYHHAPVDLRARRASVVPKLPLRPPRAAAKTATTNLNHKFT